MSEPVDIFLGFDPGGRGRCRRRNCDGNCGRGNFGWSICASHNQDAGCLCLKVIKSGVSCSAKGVLDAVTVYLSKCLPEGNVRAAGIDAPMFWNRSGEDRAVDKVIRAALSAKGCNTETVEPVNSLVGACLVQGNLLGPLLLHEFELRITETHPTALNMLDEAMINHIVGPASYGTNHERDATFAAYAAWAMWEKWEGWNDLFPKEPAPVLPLGTPVSYWMPIP